MRRGAGQSEGVLAAFVLCAASSTLAQPLQFVDATADAGVQCTQGSPLIPSQLWFMNGGSACGDFDRDGDEDLFVPMGGNEPDRLYINQGDGTFLNEAVAWGVAREHFGAGVCVGDVDNDGYLDIFVASGGPTDQPGFVTGPGFNLLYRNNGNGTFTEIAQQAGVSGLAQNAFIWGCAFGDMDLDGDLDMMWASWQDQDSGNKLWRNEGDSTFTDVTRTSFFDPVGSLLTLLAQGFSPRFVDMDGDRYPELLFVADFFGSKYLRNNTDGTFTDLTFSSGTGLDGNGMGQTVGDFNNDGHMDWYVTSIWRDQGAQGTTSGTGNMLYRGLGNHAFVEVATSAHVRDGGWGWATAAADFDNDGLLDIAETNGWPQSEWTGENAYLFRNLGSMDFESCALSSGLSYARQGRGITTFDHDDDGDIDIVFTGNGEPLELNRNDLIHDENAHWISVVLDTSNDPRVAPDGIGARITVAAGGKVQQRIIDAGSNYLSQSSLRAHFGLGAETIIDQLRVVWPDGRETALTGLLPDRRITIWSCLSEVTGDGRVDSDDFFAFLADFFAGDADLDGNGLTDSDDFFVFLNAFFTGC